MTLKMIALGLSCLVALWAHHRSYKPDSSGLFYGTRMVLLLIIVLYNAFFYVITYFTGAGINAAAVYHIKYGLEGSGYGDYLELILGTLAFGTFFALFALHADNRQRARHVRSAPVKAAPPYATLGLVFASFLISPTTWDIVRYNLEHSASAAQASRIPLADHLRVNEVAAIPGSGRRNLLFLYLESFERTYFNEEIFPGLVETLPALESRAINFANIAQVEGTGWTIAGNVSSQCGIPLVTPSHGNSMRNASQFLPRAKCLGDYLADAGYDLSLVMGSAKEFAGTEAFAKGHGFSRIIDSQTIAEMASTTPENKTYWGYDDAAVFSAAEGELARLDKKGQPFALFVSTLDTHHPKGHAAASCSNEKYGDGSNPILNSVKCSDRQVAGFINSVLHRDYADDLVIVLVSDHLAMQNSATELLQQAPQRRNLFMILDPRAATGTKHDHPGSMLDVGTTILPFLGFSGRIGLGRDLINDTSLIGQFENLNDQLALWTPDFIAMWDFPRIEYWTPIEIFTRTNEVRISGRTYKFPLLLEAGHQGKTSLYFNTDSSASHRSLTSHFLSMGPESAFLWVDKCSVLEGRPNAETQQFCVKYGQKAGQASRPLALTENLQILGASLFSPATGFRARSRSEVTNNALDPDRFIAHAGGSIGGFDYTNSLEALDHSYSLGFRHFELDIIETSDGEFVAAHDWQHWQKITNAETAPPPTRQVFLNTRIHGQFTPLDMERINDWFAGHPDAVLVTDKVNDPVRFARQFIAPERLIMELFSEQALVDAVQSTTVTPMPTFSLIKKGLSVERLRDLGVRHVAASRREIRGNLPLFEQLNTMGIKVFLYHVNFDADKDEDFAVCHDMNFAFGIYADRYDFSRDIKCPGL